MGSNFNIVKVKSVCYNNTGIKVEVGQSITIESDFSDRWKDLYIECDAEGWTSALADLPFIKHCKDMPDEKLMKLCAKIGNKCYAIGKSRTFLAEEAGELVLFANDVKYLRWNNSGSIDVTVRVS